MNDIYGLFWIVPLASVLALVFAYFFFKSMMKNSEGTPRMKEIAQYVREGAMAYIRSQYRVVALVFLVMVILLGVMAYLGVQNPFVPMAFLTGGFFSGLCGFLGMKTATFASGRTAQGASESLNKGLKVAFRSGAVMGLVVVGFALLDIAAWFYLLDKLIFTPDNMENGARFLGLTFVHAGTSEHQKLVEITVTMLTFGMGASTQALFARVGGGIYTKAADVGADLVGKVEAGIPEDDPRNPATIADNVGDNVGDVAGMGADLYESYAGSILGYRCPWGCRATYRKLFRDHTTNGRTGTDDGCCYRYYIINCWYLHGKDKRVCYTEKPAECTAAWYRRQFGPDSDRYRADGCRRLDHMGYFWGCCCRIAAGVIIGQATEYFTSDEYKPTKGIAKQTEGGTATTIIDGLAVGMTSTWVPVVTIVAGIIAAYGFAGGFSNFAHGVYGIGFAAVGMLSTLGITLATDAFGPIADNAGGNAEMAELDPEVRERTDALDMLGNTTAATGKGFAIGSAALTAMALLAAYMEEVRLWLGKLGDAATDGVFTVGQSVFYKGDIVPAVEVGQVAVQLKEATIDHFVTAYNLSLFNPMLLGGIFVGAMMAFLFSALTMKAVGRAAGSMVDEVRRQFKEMPGIMKGEQVPEYAKCVAISTKGAQREMILPSLIAIIVPILIGVLLGVAGVVGLLVGGLTTGFTLAIFMNNAGGAWDNAKKYIEKGNHGGKGSESHKSAVVGDTIGDPFKDTSGPSLNILIKLMTMVSVVMSGLTVAFSIF